MQIKFLYPRWGFENTDWNTFLADVKGAGFAGIEWFPYGENADIQQVLALLNQYQLQFAIVMTVTGQQDSFESYMKALREQLLALANMRSDEVSPLHISVQAGREYFTEQQIEACLSCCADIARLTGIAIYQETHRNKWSYAAHVVYPFLEKHPDLKLTLDVSHWFCVSESYLEDQEAAINKAILHARHIHARIGHTEGPQVWEPAAPEYAEALAAHLRIWDRWIEARIKDNTAVCTITPEFGPPPYMVFANREGSPQMEQWRLNNWMKSILEGRYQTVLNRMQKGTGV